MIFGDDPAGYPPIGSDDRAELAPDREAPSLFFLAMEQTSTSQADKVTHFSPRTTVRPESAMFRDYDPERPMARLVSSASSTHPFPNPDSAPLDSAVTAFDSGARQDRKGSSPGLEVYEHHGPFLFPKWSFASDQAPLILRQSAAAPRRPAARAALLISPPATASPSKTTPARISIASTSSPRWSTAARPAPRAASGASTATPSECAPSEVAYIPPRPKRRSVQVALTATVVGPPGEEIHVDALGQIKVQFHWDREGTYDDRSSCWIRPMQAWGGAGWGAQFIPRVGMEVIVVF